MSADRDGFKRGTNYCHRMARAGYDPRAELAAALALPAIQGAKCAAGEHEVRVAKPNYVTYIGYGRRVEPGTRYCGWCKTILPAVTDEAEGRVSQSGQRTAQA